MFIFEHHPTSSSSWKAQFILPANANAKRILKSQPCFRGERFAGVYHISTDANYLLQICDVQICFAFAFAGSMNRALKCNLSDLKTYSKFGRAGLPECSRLLCLGLLLINTPLQRFPQWAAFFKKLEFCTVLRKQNQKNSPFLNLH